MLLDGSLGVIRRQRLQRPMAEQVPAEVVLERYAEVEERPRSLRAEVLEAFREARHGRT